MNEKSWEDVSLLVTWLDTNRAQMKRSGDSEFLLRVMKIGEELGEVIEAVIGATGQNPRKGITNDWGKVHDELCDVIVTAMVALVTATRSPYDARDEFDAHLKMLIGRTIRKD